MTIEERWLEEIKMLEEIIDERKKQEEKKLIELEQEDIQYDKV